MCSVGSGYGLGNVEKNSDLVTKALDWDSGDLGLIPGWAKEFLCTLGQSDLILQTRFTKVFRYKGI